MLLPKIRWTKISLIGNGKQCKKFKISELISEHIFISSDEYDRN